MASVLTAPFLCTELLFAFLEGWEVSHNHVTDSQGWLAPGKQAGHIPSTAPHLHSPHQGTCSKWSHLSHQTSLTRTKCSLLSLVEASSGYKAAFSGLRILRQNREQCPFHLPWLTFFTQLQKWRSWELWRMARSLHHSLVNCQPFPLLVSSPLTSNNLSETPIYSIRTGTFHTRFSQCLGYKLKVVLYYWFQRIQT